MRVVPGAAVRLAALFEHSAGHVELAPVIGFDLGVVPIVADDGHLSARIDLAGRLAFTSATAHAQCEGDREDGSK